MVHFIASPHEQHKAIASQNSQAPKYSFNFSRESSCMSKLYINMWISSIESVKMELSFNGTVNADAKASAQIRISCKSGSVFVQSTLCF